MKVNVFGASGFVGSYLCQYLKCKIYPISLRTSDWSYLLPESPVWINCIGKAHDHKGEATKEDFFKANFELVKDIFSAFVESRAELLIHISSIAAVEEIGRGEMLTESSVQTPMSYYGLSKKNAEDYLLQQKLPAGKKVVILRPVMIHGEGHKGNLRQLYRMIERGVPYPFAAFENSRSFISIDNVIFIIENIIAQKDSFPSGVYNVADDSPLSTLDLINIMSGDIGKKILLLKVPKTWISAAGRLGDILKLPVNSTKIAKMTSNLVVSNRKIKEQLKLKKLPLSAQHGLRLTIESFKADKPG